MPPAWGKVAIGRDDTDGIREICCPYARDLHLPLHVLDRTKVTYVYQCALWIIQLRSVRLGYHGVYEQLTSHPFSYGICCARGLGAYDGVCINRR